MGGELRKQGLGILGPGPKGQRGLRVGPGRAARAGQRSGSGRDQGVDSEGEQAPGSVSGWQVVLAPRRQGPWVPW